MEYYKKKKLKKNTTVTFLKTVSQNAPDCISAHISLKKLFWGLAPGPPRKLVATQVFSSKR